MNTRVRNLLFGLAALGVFATGCGSKEPEDTAPLDIRGKPIEPVAEVIPVPTTNSPSAAVVQPPPISATLTEAAGAGGSGLRVPEPDGDGIIHVGFDVLAGYPYPETHDPLPADAAPMPSRIPESLRALNGHAVAIKGFMLPMKLQSGLATELLLMRDQSMCCFGVVPRINDWVSVKMRGRGVKPIQDQPVTIFGTFEAGETYENGYLVSLYRLVGERMETALDW